MKQKSYLLATLLFGLLFGSLSYAADTPNAAIKEQLVPYSTTEYLVLAHKNVLADTEWKKVAETLSANHNNAPTLSFDNHPADALERLKAMKPRYVAIVDRPDNIDYRYVIKLHQMSRKVDEDIYADFLWGIISGYTAQAALKTVSQSVEPMTIETAVSTTSQIRNARWIQRYAWIDDNKPGSWGEKKSAAETPVSYSIESSKVLGKFVEIYKTYNPELLVTASHASETNVELPFAQGILLNENGKILIYPSDNPLPYLYSSGKRKVFLPIGNCLVGDANSTPNSQVMAWMNHQTVTHFVGYTTVTWFGRGGWGMLKYFINNPGRNTTAEAFYLNQQDMLYTMNAWNNRFHTIAYPFATNKMIFDIVSDPRIAEEMEKIDFHDWNREIIGFLFDRDVVTFYGDPAWNVRLTHVADEDDYTVSASVVDKQFVITVKTAENFSLERMKGNKFVQEIVKDIPFSYFFPERLLNPRLAEGQNWKISVNENSILVYDPDFEPNKTYTIVLNIDNAIVSGIEKNNAALPGNIFVKNRRLYSNTGDTFAVFDIAGKQLPSESQLSKGFYIVKSRFGSQKIMIR